MKRKKTSQKWFVGKISKYNIRSYEHTTGTGCGADSQPEEKPSAWGTACGAGDKPAEAPEEKPSSCGTECGAFDK